MGVHNEEQHLKRKIELMERSYACMAEIGLSSVGVRALGKYCGCNTAVFYNYFQDMDDLIVQATAHCMSKVEDEFMAKAPRAAADIERFLDEIPYWTAREHGAKYRLMYQVYTHPKYIEHGKKFFEGVNQRYAAYARQLEDKIGLPSEITTPLIFMIIRASVHYAMFEDEFYLKAQMGLIKQVVQRYLAQFAAGQTGTAEA